MKSEPLKCRKPHLRDKTSATRRNSATVRSTPALSLTKWLRTTLKKLRGEGNLWLHVDIETLHRRPVGDQNSKKKGSYLRQRFRKSTTTSTYTYWQKMERARQPIRAEDPNPGSAVFSRIRKFSWTKNLETLIRPSSKHKPHTCETWRPSDQRNPKCSARTDLTDLPTILKSANAECSEFENQWNQAVHHQVSESAKNQSIKIDNKSTNQERRSINRRTSSRLRGQEERVRVSE